MGGREAAACLPYRSMSETRLKTTRKMASKLLSESLRGLLRRATPRAFPSPAEPTLRLSYGCPSRSPWRGFACGQMCMVQTISVAVVIRGQVARTFRKVLHSYSERNALVRDVIARRQQEAAATQHTEQGEGTLCERASRFRIKRAAKLVQRAWRGHRTHRMHAASLTHQVHAANLTQLAHRRSVHSQSCPRETAAQSVQVLQLVLAPTTASRPALLLAAFPQSFFPLPTSASLAHVLLLLGQGRTNEMMMLSVTFSAAESARGPCWQGSLQCCLLRGRPSRRGFLECSAPPTMVTAGFFPWGLPSWRGSLQCFVIRGLTIWRVALWVTGPCLPHGQNFVMYSVCLYFQTTQTVHRLRSTAPSSHRLPPHEPRRIAAPCFSQVLAALPHQIGEELRPSPGENGALLAASAERRPLARAKHPRTRIAVTMVRTKFGAYFMRRSHHLLRGAVVHLQAPYRGWKVGRGFALQRAAIIRIPRAARIRLPQARTRQKTAPKTKSQLAPQLLLQQQRYEDTKEMQITGSLMRNASSYLPPTLNHGRESGDEPAAQRQRIEGSAHGTAHSEETSCGQGRTPSGPARHPSAARSPVPSVAMPQNLPSGVAHNYYPGTTRVAPTAAELWGGPPPVAPAAPDSLATPPNAAPGLVSRVAVPGWQAHLPTGMADLVAGAAGVKLTAAELWGGPPAAPDSVAPPSIPPLAGPSPSVMTLADAPLPRNAPVLSHFPGDVIGDLTVVAAGGCGAVYEGLKSDGTRVAVKVLFSNGVEATAMLLREGIFMAACEDAHVLRCQGTVSLPTWPSPTTGLVMDWAAASLHDVLYSSGRPPTERLLARMSGPARAFAQMHARGIIHCDIKPGNLLVMLEGNVVVADFGFAQVLDADGTAAVSFLGTPMYEAPEVLTGGKPSKASDVWSWGMTLYEVAFKCLPYPGFLQEHLVQYVLAGGIPILPWDCHPILRQILLSCWDMDPARRMDFVDIVPLLESIGVEYEARLLEYMAQGDQAHNIMAEDEDPCIYHLPSDIVSY